MKRWIALGTATVVAGAAFAAVDRAANAHRSASADRDRAVAVLRDPTGARVGTVVFASVGGGATQVMAVLQRSGYVTTSAFHGFHVHANNVPSNGTGCVADASKPSSTWFVSADGHFGAPGEAHPDHDGDMPAPLVGPDGSATVAFTTTRLTPRAVLGKAVVLHADPDNFGNVPVGSLADEYHGNSLAALDKTHLTGNSGARVACGVVTAVR